ncbi:MAG TPA: 2-dehydropantoate 2-reductase N-terminal domain-containing protein [Nocardia sp.]|uniref:ketopantoate reductase family protein n=1 Tax=Nocardia TaxID=1817 RepID=UPI00245607F1|nr:MULTISPECIES: 2-dehydropantoate 2-reductase N-terminal domain-containing protein [Nocardia]HLS77573.1 2-dehydropantoate 2-reductase N-terminal domain-containing protein [Nocardia sp.]
MTRYVVIGAGAVGAGLAAQLELHGLPYVLVGRGAQIAHLAERGLTYHRRGTATTVPLVTAAAPAEVTLTTDDVLVFTPKVQDLDAAVRDWAWQPVAGAPGRTAADLPVITLQNGLDAERIALRRFAHVWGASLLTPARFTVIGEVVSGAAGPVGVLTIGRYPSGSDERLESVAADLRAAEYIVQISDDVVRWKAAKIVHNVRNAVEVLSGDAEEKARIEDALVAETHAALAAAGIEVADTVAERTEDLSEFRLDPDSGIRPGQQSTWQSFARGVPAETDYLNGEIVLLGRLHGVDVPVNAAIQAVLGASSLAGEKPGTRTTTEVIAAAEQAATLTGKAHS